MSHYHHGNLRNALIVAAAELIEEKGSSDFSMIEASRRAGVSSAAPYRHFKDKDALLEAVCQLAFLSLSQETMAAASGIEKGTAEHIMALGEAYVVFMKNHPEFYALMWGDAGMRSMDADSQRLNASGFFALVESIQTHCDKAGIVDKSAATTVAAKLWGLVHGLGSLYLNQHLEKLIPGADVYSLLEASTHTFLNEISAPRD